MTIREIIHGLLKTEFTAVGTPYTVEAPVVYAKSGANRRPALDHVDGIKFVKRLLVWAGVAWIAVAVKLGRSLIDMLTEASAEFGEWAMGPIIMRRGRRFVSGK